MAPTLERGPLRDEREQTIYELMRMGISTYRNGV